MARIERSCGECRVCCTLGEVPEINKPSHVECWHACESGCAIYDKPERPKVCLDFECAWKRGAGAETDRPDIIGAMFTVNKEQVRMAAGSQNAPIIYAIETRRRSLYTTAKSMAVEMAQRFKLPIIIIGSDERPPNDYGQRIVLSDQMLAATRKIRGKTLRSFAENVTVFELKHGSGSRIN